MKGEIKAKKGGVRNREEATEKARHPGGQKCDESSRQEAEREDEGGEEAEHEIRRWRKVRTSKESEIEKILYEGWRETGCSEQRDDTMASRLPPGGGLQQRNKFLTHLY